MSPRHLEAAVELGREAARRGLAIVFGGGNVGLMGALADGVLAEGGEVTGVIPEHLRAKEVAHNGLSDLIVVDSMHTRKRKMFDLSDAFCVLPGGMGTLDETFEILTWRQLGLHDKPIIVVNVDGFWGPFLKLFEHQVEAGYIRPPDTRLFRVVERVASVFDALAEAPAPGIAADTDRL